MFFNFFIKGQLFLALCKLCDSHPAFHGDTTLICQHLIAHHVEISPLITLRTDTLYLFLKLPACLFIHHPPTTQVQNKSLASRKIIE